MCYYKYGKKHQEKYWQPNGYPDWLSEVSRKVEKMLELPPMHFNSCNANAYTMPNHDLTFHKDNEPLFREADAPTSKRSVMIASLSFGQTRKFSIRRLYSGDKPIEIHLEDGDVVTMEGLMQDNFHHAISAADPAQSTSASSTTPNVRYNLTFRCIKRHIKDCKWYESLRSLTN